LNNKIAAKNQMTEVPEGYKLNLDTLIIYQKLFSLNYFSKYRIFWPLNIAIRKFKGSSSVLIFCL